MAINNDPSTTKEKSYSVRLEPNALHQYASYNYIFTLSALSPTEIRDPGFLLRNAPGNIIARSGGIGAFENDPAASQNPGLDPDLLDRLFTKRSVDTGDEPVASANNTGLFRKIVSDQNTLAKNRDIYFESVEIDTVHGLNGDRATATNTSIRMRLTEPTGVTLINKIRAAAVNNGFLDHVDAPFLLTIQFTGFDEKGRVKPIDQVATTKKIPIKIVKMEVNINQAGSVYDLVAIPYNEFPLVNRFNYLRGTNTIKKQENLEGFVRHFEKLLNDQITSETQNGYFESTATQDVYRITVDESLKDRILESEKNTLRQLDMGDGQDDDQRIGYTTLGQTTGNHTIVKILEETMKSLAEFQPNKLYEEWDRKTQISAQSTNPDDFYVDFFRIKTSVIPTTTFDTVTKNNKKILHYHIAPFKIHAYSLNRPGVSSGRNAQTVVHKRYDYIFTGNNTDILDLDLKYNVAYYQSQLKDYRPQTDDPTTGLSYNWSRASDTETVYGENGLPLKGYINTAQTAQSGVIDPNPSRIQTDQFVDALTNPTADMVNINMKILGDPSWIGQSQFMMLNVGEKNVTQSADNDSNSGTDRGTGIFTTIPGNPQSWSEKYKSFNTDQAEPVINLRFVMPNDFNEKTGMYELNTTADGVFSGLYKVWKTVSTFDNGTFTQNLYAIRFNNQGEEKTQAVRNVEYVLDKTQTVSRTDYEKDPTSFSGSF
jgi:hypothetical protein